MLSFAVHDWLSGPDALVGACLAPLAIAILVSGVDDLVVDAVWAAHWIRAKLGWTSDAAPRRPEREKRIAIFVPLWREHAVIGRMLEHNIAAIDYRNYDFFVGAYPNDQPTLDAVRAVEAHHANVHLAVCPHDGPTSKADCLNWIYQRMLLHEEHHAIRFDVVATHDAEDLIHPESLRVLNQYTESYDMVQVPVLPLPTSALEVVHGVYCDEFAEFQIKDMQVRRLMGSFTPSSGVGTGYTRAALEKLAESSSNRVFEPICLTEDYENGMRLHALGCSQIFVPLRVNAASAIATREYFPRRLRAAIQQRTRWVTGIALQAWERHGWKGPPGQVYWLWRDRKGLIGNPLSIFANLVFLYGLATLPAGSVARLGHCVDPRISALTLALLAYRMGLRMACVGRLYGLRFALGLPIRSVCANLINSLASFLAMDRFARAKIRGEPLVWLKTEHAYPSREALLAHKRGLEEILAGSGYIDESDLRRALETKPEQIPLGDYLVFQGLLGEDALLEALSLQQGLPMGKVDPDEVAPNAMRALPRDVVRNWRVLPFRITGGNLHVATPDAPTEELTRRLRGFTRMEMQFQLITSENFERLLKLLA